jgi:hypothetical protein
MVHADAVNSFKSGRRRLNINGNFDLWQRGTSFTNVANVYTADRWFLAGGGAMDCTRQTGTSSDLHTYYSRVQRPSGQTHTNTNLGYAFELVDIVPLRGKTITASCKLRKGANYSATSDLISVVFGANNDSADQNKSQNYIDGITSTSKTLTSSWQTFSFTTTVHAQAVAMVFRASATTTGTAGANDYFDIAEVQVEVSSTATDFEHRSYAEELALCQRYYEIGEGGMYQDISTTSDHLVNVDYRATKRVSPTLTKITGYENCCSSVSVQSAYLDATLAARVRGNNVFTTGANKTFYVKFSADAEL